MPEERIKTESYANIGGINRKASRYVTGENDSLDLFNLDFQIPGSLNQAPGSAPWAGFSVAGPITGLYEYEKLSGFSQVIFSANTSIYHSNGVGAPVAFRTGLTSGALFDFTTFVDTLFASNGVEFFKWDGTNAYPFSAPGPTLAPAAGAEGTTVIAGFTGLFQYAYGYLNTTGYHTPVGAALGVSISANAGVISGFTVPSGFGITAIAIYRSSPNATDLFRIGYLPVGSQTFIDFGFPLQNFPDPEWAQFTLAPRFLELFQNSLFLVGFSSAPSTSYFAEPGVPEAIYPTSFFESRTNDGDRLTGAKYYDGALYLFKQRSFTKVVGDNGANYTQLDVSDQYGALSNRAIQVYERTMLFLDRKGIARFDGSTPEIISSRYEDIFLRMNVPAALDKATSVHNRLRNEIWFAFPIDGATLNNCIVVYDYLADSFTRFGGYEPAVLAMIQANQPKPTAFFGSYAGTVHYTSASIFNHGGESMIMRWKTRFYALYGNAWTTQYRQLYVNHALIPAGASAAIQVDFMRNESDDVVLSREIPLGTFQTRMQMGIPARSLGMEFTASSASFPIRIDGITLEGRLQRKV